MNMEGHFKQTGYSSTHHRMPDNHSTCRKCYKALIDLGATISLTRYSTYQSVNSSLKTPLHATTTKLNTADGSPMMALGMTALHLRIVVFKFTHTFIICNRLPDIEIVFGIDIQKKNCL